MSWHNVKLTIILTYLFKKTTTTIYIKTWSLPGENVPEEPTIIITSQMKRMSKFLNFDHTDIFKKHKLRTIHLMIATPNKLTETDAIEVRFPIFIISGSLWNFSKVYWRYLNAVYTKNGRKKSYFWHFSRNKEYQVALSLQNI